ncbi:PLP-dependent transferase, partial [Serendipita vermifera]
MAAPNPSSTGGAAASNPLKSLTTSLRQSISSILRIRSSEIKQRAGSTSPSTMTSPVSLEKSTEALKSSTNTSALGICTSPLGSSIPANMPHAVSVSLPTWQDNVDYEEGNKRVVDVMNTGYPRFFIHRSIQKLSAICEQKFGNGDEKCMIFPSITFATACRDFMTSKDSTTTARIVQFLICPQEDTSSIKSNLSSKYHARVPELHIILFPSQHWALAKSFWQHTGTGISSRLAENCLVLLESMGGASVEADNQPKAPGRGRNRHYFSKSREVSNKDLKISSNTGTSTTTSSGFNGIVRAVKSAVLGPVTEDAERLEEEETRYLEERYARVLPQFAAQDAKRALRRRIAGVILRDVEYHHRRKMSTSSPPSSPTSPSRPTSPSAVLDDQNVGPSTRGVPNVSENDVFLFPTGMSAIWHTHQLLLKTFGQRESICWGFPYVDTLKILQKWGPGCQFFGHGDEYEALEALLKERRQQNPNEPPFLALFCEVTSNPLLKTPDLRRLRALADEYNFAIAVDETVGNYANVGVLPYCDVVCDSLTKVFSGEVNVMGGGMVLNPQGRHYEQLRKTLLSFYEDTYWDEDSIFLERNSRDFQTRVYAINKNAETICDLLYSRSLEAANKQQDKAQEPSSSSASTHAQQPVVKKVYYPKWIDTDTYNSFKSPQGGYGGLFSITFTSPVAAKAFFDNLGCEKGPSLGTNFTLACPFVILAHYTELEWAQGYGVDPYLVRMSVGLEKEEVLVRWIEHALECAEEAVRKSDDET